jgi:L-2-hydroxyglutarate oxidase LhgO
LILAGNYLWNEHPKERAWGPSFGFKLQMDKVECVVIGAGVIGLAIARRLARAGREVIVLEAAEGIGTVTSSRNSEVIHAGIYYPAGSLMAQMCVSGRRALYEYCLDHGIPHRNCGKLIVATTARETEKLQSIKAHAEANGVLDMQTLSGQDARALEPALNSDAALLSPSTGIIDSHAFMLALRGEAEDAGAAFAFHTPLLRARASAAAIELDAGGSAPVSLECRLLVNAAGLGATAVARSMEGMPIELIPRAYLAKGTYFSCSARAPFSHLIYPVPEPGGLAVHLTLDMAGQARFGHDVEWV